MDRQRIAQVLRRWGWLIPLGMLLVGGTSFAVSRAVPPTYAATATLLVQQQASSVTGPQYQDVLASERLARTYGQMVLTYPVLEQVIGTLGLNTTPEELSKRLSTRLLRETQLIHITAEDGSPTQAQRIANAVAQVFMEQNRRLTVGSFTQSKENLARQIAKLSSEIDNTTGMVDRLRGVVVSGTGTPQDTLMLQQLQTELSQTQVTYSTLLKTLQEIELAEARAAEGLRLIEPAVEPTRPAHPNVLLNTLAGLLVGLVGSVGLLGLLHSVDDTLKGSEDSGRALDLPVLGVIGQFQPSVDRAHDLVLLRSPRSSLAESYRTLRTNLQFSSLDVPLHSIVVTSAASREGKSTVAANLAITLAQAGRRVLLVDADLRRPSQHHLFSVSNRKGLTSLLLDDRLSVSDVAVETEVSGLRVVPAGPQPPNPAELLTATRMRRLLEEMQAHADLVVLDSPPVLAVADGLALGATVDGTLLVVRSGNTRRTMARHATQQLSRVEACLLGVVVNATPRYAVNYGYYAPYYVETDREPRPGTPTVDAGVPSALTAVAPSASHGGQVNGHVPSDPPAKASPREN